MQTQVALNGFTVWPQTEKCAFLSGAGALYSMLEAMEHMGGSLSAPGAVLHCQSSPEHIIRAIRLVEEQEVLLDGQAILKAVGLFLHNPSLATAYLDFGRQGLLSKWLEQELSVDPEAAASQLRLRMLPME